MIRNDGNYIIYIIQFKYSKDDTDKSWHNAGDCGRWIKKCKTRKQWENITFKNPFRSFSASGKCWQLTSIHGTFKLDHASNILMKIAKWNPGREFRVAKIDISQTTTGIITSKM